MKENVIKADLTFNKRLSILIVTYALFTVPLSYFFLKEAQSIPDILLVTLMGICPIPLIYSFGRFHELVKPVIRLILYFLIVIPMGYFFMKTYEWKVMELPLLFRLIPILFCPVAILFDFVKFLHRICRIVDTMNEWIGRVVAWSTLLVVVVVFTDVVMRYGFKTSFVFMQELEWHLFAFIFLIGAGCTLLKEGHVRVDIIYQRLGEKAQGWVNLMGVLLFLLPGCYMIIATSIPFAQSSWQVLEGSPDPGGIPYRFILKACIPVGFIFITLQGISMGIKSVFAILDIEIKKPAAAPSEKEAKRLEE